MRDAEKKIWERKALAEVGGEAAVLFDGGDGCGALEQGAGQDAEAGADLDDGIVGAEFGGIKQDVQDVAVDEEILAENARGVEVELRQQGSDFGGACQLDGIGHFGDFIRVVGLVSGW